MLTLATAIMLFGCGGEEPHDNQGVDAAPPPSGQATPADSAPETRASSPSESSKPATLTVQTSDPAALASGLLADSTPTSQYTPMPDGVWRAHLALKTALAADPVAEIETSLAAARERYTGFGSVGEHAHLVGQVVVVAHYLGNNELEETAMSRLVALGEDAFDAEESARVESARILSLAHMADKPGSDRVGEFSAEFDKLLGADDASLDALADLFQYYYENPGAEEIARMILLRPAEMEAIAISGTASNLWALQRLAWWRNWQQLAEIAKAPNMLRLRTWDTYIEVAVIAEFEGDTALADRFAELGIERLRMDGRGEDVLAVEREAVAWMRKHVRVADKEAAKALFNEDPEVASNRRSPGQTLLKRFKRDIVAAALIRSGFVDRGDQLILGANQELSLPAVIFDAYADAGQWEKLSGYNPRFGMAQQLLTYGMRADTRGWPELVVDFARRARTAGEEEVSQLLLISAAGAESHPGNAAVAREIASQLGTAEALGGALQAARDQTGGRGGGFTYPMINRIVREGVPAEAMLQAMNVDRSALSSSPLMGVTLAYATLGMPVLW
jgi:hypothetical protein